MYLEYYNLNTKPFRKTPDPEFFFASAGHAEALERMRYAVEEREVMVLTGEVGSGKTTISRALIDSLDEMYHVALIINPVLTPNGFLRTLALRLGAEKPRYFKADLIEQVSDLLFAQYEEGFVPVIMIDEAHLVPGRPTFEEIRLLTNFQLDKENILSVLLLGQPELGPRLKRPQYSAFTQRIGMSYDLPPLTRSETRDYVAHRLTKAGRAKQLFDDGAQEVLWRVSGGLPRKINNLASAALLEGYGRGARTVTRDIILDAARDLGMITDDDGAHLDAESPRASPSRKKTASKTRKAA